MVQSELRKPERLRVLRSLISCTLFFAAAPPPMAKLPDTPKGLDGIELDGKGNIYVSEILLNQI